MELYVKGKIDDNGSPLKVVHDFINPRWEIALTLSEKGFQNVSFVNSIATTKVRGCESLDIISYWNKFEEMSQSHTSKCAWYFC